MRILPFLAVLLLLSMTVTALSTSSNNLTLYYPNATALGEKMSASCFDTGNHTQYGLSGVWMGESSEGTQMELGSGRTYARGLQFETDADYFRFNAALSYNQTLTCTSADGRTLAVNAPLYIVSPGSLNWADNFFGLFALHPELLLNVIGLIFLIFIVLGFTQLPRLFGWLKDNFS